MMHTPELALLSRDADTGVAKLGFTVVEAGSGALSSYSPAEPAYGFSNHIRWSILLLIGWTDSDLLPEGQQEEADGRLTGPADP
jgi:hypothetical protein